MTHTSIWEREDKILPHDADLPMRCQYTVKVYSFQNSENERVG